MKKVSKIVTFGVLIVSIAINGNVWAASPNDGKNLDNLLNKYPMEDKVLEIDVSSKEVTVDGETTTLSDELNITQAQEDVILSKSAYIEQRMEAYGYEKDNVSDGVMEFTNRFATKRLLICGENPSDNYGAIETVSIDANTYIFQYKEEIDAKNAYNKLLKDGIDVFVDEVIDNALDYLPERNSCIDDGAEAMGLSYMQNNEYYQKNEVVVAVIDTGVTAANIGSDRIVKATSKVAGNPSEEDVINHGNRVCQVIVDSTSDNVKVMPIKVFTDSEKTSSAYIISALRYAIHNGADVINMSLGDGEEDGKMQSTYFNDLIDEAIEDGIPVVVSAGNEGHSTKYCYPAYYEPCWTISAVNDSKIIASFSNYENIDFTAPGVSIKGYGLDGSLGTISGTSFSAPYMSALTAQLKGGNNYKSVSEEYEEIKSMCIDLGDTGYDSYYGYGFPHYTANCTEHEYVLTDTVSGSCNTEGKLTYTCKNCGAVKYESTGYDYNVHNKTRTSTVAATCEEDGYILKKCRYCNAEISKTVIPALGHDYILSSSTPSTCIEQGYNLSICSRCGDEKKEYLELNALNHKNTSTQVTPSTCISQGKEEEFCNDCGALVSSNILPLAEHDYELIESVEAKCEVQGYDEYECTVCHNTKIVTHDALVHDWHEETVAPTLTSDGYVEQKCSICGEEKDKQEIPAMTVEVKRVVDGDTIIVDSNNNEYRVRFIGVNTPESVSSDETKNTPEGTVASNYTKGLLQQGDTIYLEYDESYFDVYGRILAYPWLKNVSKTYTNFKVYNVGALLLQNTYCTSVYYAPNGKYKNWYDMLYNEYQPYQEPSTESTTEATTEATTQASTQATTEKKTEATTEKKTEVTTQATTATTTEKTTSQATTQQKTEKTTEVATTQQKTTEKATQATTASQRTPLTTTSQATTQQKTEKTTEVATTQQATTEKSTQAGGYSYVTATTEQKNVKTTESNLKIKNLKGKNLKGRKLKISYKRIGGAEYQIQYSTNKKFKKKTTVYTSNILKVIKGLKKGKRYFIRVRAYNSSGIDIKYGKWSKTISVKIKK